MNRRTLFFCLLVVFLVGDVVTTTYALREMECAEGNPVAALFVASPVMHLGVKIGFAGVVVLLARQTDRILPGAGIYCVVAAALFYALPCANNLYWILV